MECAELCLRLLPGSRPLLVSDDGTPSPPVAALAHELLHLFMSLSEDEPSEPQACAEKCAGLLSDLPRCLNLGDGLPQQKGADALSSFIWLGMTSIPMGVQRDLAGRVWVALRVLGRLISAASTKEELRPIIGFPAVWCGVDLIKNISAMRPDSLPPITALEEFSSPLVLASTDELAPHSLVGGCLCCEAYHAWYCCLLSARAELAVCGTTTVAYRMLPQLVGSAFVAAARALDACSENGNQTELLLLTSTARLFSLTNRIAQKAALPAPDLQRMLWSIDDEPIMVAHIRAVQRLRTLVLPREDSDDEDSGDEGHEPTTRTFSPETQVEMLESLKGVLSSLLVFLETGMQVVAFIRNGGVDILLRAFEVYNDKKGQLGHLEDKYEEVLTLVAGCMAALLGSYRREEAQQQFVAAGGYQRLLDTVDALPLRQLVETFLSTGRHTVWHMQCASMRVLELATMECPEGRVELIAEGGIESLIRAARWEPDKLIDCSVSDHYRRVPQTQEQKVGLRDLSASVAAHALAVVGQVCIGEGKIGGEQEVHPFSMLVGNTSLQEMEQLLKLGEVSWDQSGGRPWAPLLAKIAPFSPLRASVILCTHILLGKGVEEREAFMALKYKELFLAHLGFVQQFEGGGAQALAKSLVLEVFAKLLGERVAWRRDLLQQRVHLLAGATLTQAVTTLKHETLAGRKARLQKLQARSRGRAGAGACGCGRPGCTLDNMGGFGSEGPEQESARARRIQEASSLLVSSLSFLEALQKVGKEGRQATLEVLESGSLAQAANANPSLSSISADLKGPEASLKEWLAWGQQLVQQSGGKRITQLDAEKAAEAAAAALLAEEEAVQRKAAAKAAKRQRRKAAKQQSKQHGGAAEQPEIPFDAELHGTDMEHREVAAAGTTNAAGDTGGFDIQTGEPDAAALPQGGNARRPIDADPAASSCASQELELTQEAQLSEARGSGLWHTGSKGGSQRQALRPSQNNEQVSGSQEVAAGRTAGRAVKFKKPQKAKEPQQSARPLQSGSLRQPATGLLPAAQAGNEQAPPAIIPALAAILGPAAPAGPAAESAAAAVTAPATPSRPAPPAVPPPSSADRSLLGPAAAAVATSAAAPAATAEGPAALEAAEPLPALPAAEAQVAEYEALLGYLLPGISLTERKPQARPTSQESAAPATNGRLAAGSQANNGLPPEASSREQQQQQQKQQQTDNFPAELGVDCGSGGGSKLPPALEGVLVCRLTGQQLSDPVIAGDGYTYEREALTAWLLDGKLRSPVTGRPLSTGAIRPNLAVRELLSALTVC